MKCIIFEVPNALAVKWYAIIHGQFYYWSDRQKLWILSTNVRGQNERRLKRAINEGRTRLVKLKGEIE